MNRQHNKLTQRQQEEQESVSGHQTQSHAEGKEFKTPEEALRYDRDQNPVPARVGARLNQSAEALPRPRRRWWQFWEH